MRPRRSTRRPLTSLTVLVAATCATALTLTTPAAGAPSANKPAAPRSLQLEHLDRGLVAATTGEGVFLSWRLLASEVTGHTSVGLTGSNFNVYRDGQRIATVANSTNYLDRGAPANAVYRVAAVVSGQEVDKSAPSSPWASNYHNLPLKRPAAGVTPAGEAYTYRANDMSVGDVDGDGQYEYVVKWEPTNSKDVSQVGYTGSEYIDAYKFDGTLLYRIDLGVNIRAGAHYTDFLVFDFDGDGKSEIIFKTAPGTKITQYDKTGGVTSEKYITMPKEDLKAGYRNTDDYRLSAAGYYEHLVKVFRGWDKHPEVTAGHWPKTLEQAFGVAPKYTYPLSDADARALVDYFMDVYAPSRSARNVLRKFEGFILSGPEYLTVFEGASGKELQTVRYEPGRTDDGLMWGDYAMGRIEPGNRVDRFLATVAYLDGKRPSAVFARGYYTRSTLHSFNWDGKKLSKVWDVDSGWVPMANPFNDSPHGRDGTDPEFGKITTQGSHTVSVGDVDGDGKQEIVYGGTTIDDNGRLLYSSAGVMPPESPQPGVTVRVGHGDALHVTDIDPDRPGMEIYMVHEGGTGVPYGYAMRDGKTGEPIFGAYSGRDTGRGMIGDVRPDVPGLETWAAMPPNSADQPVWGLLSAKGEKLGNTVPGTNMSVRWAADMTTQFVHGQQTETYEVPTIRDWTKGVVLTATDTSTNNWTKGTPSLVADVLGDWREEVLLRTVDSSAIRIYLSTEVTDRKLYTLMHDSQYRADVARQQTGYNQPSYPSFYLASDIRWDRVPVPRYWAPGSLQALRNQFEELNRSGAIVGEMAHKLRNDLRKADAHLRANRPAQVAAALRKFQDQLDEPKRRSQISPEARAALDYQAGVVIKMLS